MKTQFQIKTTGLKSETAPAQATEIPRQNVANLLRGHRRTRTGNLFRFPGQRFAFFYPGADLIIEIEPRQAA